jgi:valyl-tRNA synthetase
MIFSGLEHMEQKPFSTVFIHGLVRDAQGRKMSKSLGNGIDPLEMISRYGADALRFTLATGNSPGNDMRFSEEKIEASRNFANKLWNASRFVLMNLDIDSFELPENSELGPEDKWILSEFNALAASVNDNLEKYEVGVALSGIYDFVWDRFCDWYIELVKPALSDKGSARNKTVQNVLCYVLTGILKLLHPYMPFITEEIYQTLPHDCESIMISAFPTYSADMSYEEEAQEMERIIGAIRAIRTRRAEMNVAPSRKAKLYIVTPYPETFGQSSHAFFVKLASASEVCLVDRYESDDAVSVVTDAATVYIPLSDIIDFEAERKRLESELKKIEGEIARLDGKLSNQGFIAKAPAAVVEGERAKLDKYLATKAGLLEAIQKLDK